REILDNYIGIEFTALTQVARKLAYKWFSLFDSLAEDPEHAAKMLLHEAYIEAISTFHLCDPGQDQSDS
ncbi:MAG: hypothetical protein J2P36_32935, partial [Ktedonobacteraceae bacterium]|nr:hypothetical protein [Ktedonobacteraceae bacterium]